MTTTQTEPVPASLSSIRQKLGVGEPTISEWLNFLFYADSGVGKTHFCGTALEDERLYPLLILDCEGGDHTLNPYKIHRRGDIDFKQVRSIKQLGSYHNELYKFNNGWYKTVAIDNLTEVNDIDMRDIMAVAIADSSSAITDDAPSPREWGLGRNHLRKIIRSYKDLPLNLVVTCYETLIEKEGKPDKYEPSLVPAKLRTEIPGFMDLVAWYRFSDSRHTKRIMQFEGTRRVKAKSRFRNVKFPETVEDPTLPMIYDLFKKGIEEAKKKETNEDESSSESD